MLGLRIKVVIRILLAIGLGLAGYYFLTETPYFLLAGWMFAFFLLAIFDLIRVVEKSERDLTHFLMAIRQNDFTNTYPENKSGRKPLYAAFNLITNEFKRLRVEKESNFHFLQTVVEHSGVPLIAFTMADEAITLINKSAKDLFGIPHFTKLASLSRISEDLVRTIREMGPSDKVLLKLELNGRVNYISIIARELVLQNTHNKVVAFHNINTELDQQEIESWHKLIRVMTHEIKNSVIPISTLTEVINGMFDDKAKAGQGLQDFTQEDEEDLLTGLKTIEKRSKGLVKFVTNYGNLARVPKPELQLCDLKEIITGVVQLQQHQLDQNDISLQVATPEQPCLLMLDKQMIEQVLINLIKNAMEALIETETIEPQIHVTLAERSQGLVVEVRDNGPGMDPETRENIFIPFFTTKKEGSGIGLSYSRQIMRAHQGNISVRSAPGVGTTFELRF